MTAAFGDVLQSDSAPDSNQTPDSAVPTNGSAPAEAISLDDPRLLSSENIDSNESGDTYAMAPPLPDGKWRAKLSLADIKDPRTGQNAEHKFIASLAGWKTPPTPFLAVNIQSEILDASGKFDGVKLTEYWVKTLKADRGPGQGTSPLATVIRKSGGVVKEMNARQVLELALSHFAKEPEVVVETVWTARCQSCEEAAEKRGDKKPKPFLRGQHRFPSLKAGENSPEAQCPTCKTVCRAQPVIVQYHPVSTPHR